MRMIGAGVNFQFCVLLATEATFREHAPDGTLQHQYRTAFADHARSFHFFATDEASEAGINFFRFLIAAQADLIGIDDYHEVASVDVGSEDWLVLAAQEAGGFDSHGAEDIILGIDDVPCALHILWLGGKCFHVDYMAVGEMLILQSPSGQCRGRETY